MVRPLPDSKAADRGGSGVGTNGGSGGGGATIPSLQQVDPHFQAIDLLAARRTGLDVVLQCMLWVLRPRTPTSPETCTVDEAAAVLSDPPALMPALCRLYAHNHLPLAVASAALARLRPLDEAALKGVAHGAGAALRRCGAE